MTSIFLLLGAIAAIIYYVIQMRRAKMLEEQSDEQGNMQGNMKDVFITTDDEYLKSKLLNSDPYDDLERLASLYERGILTKEEFDAKKKEILERI